jgi:hypothetical protein
LRIKCRTKKSKAKFIKYWGKEFCSKCALERRRKYNRERMQKKLSDPIVYEKHLREVTERQKRLKIEVLTHYGKNGILQCCWPDCDVVDIDCLTLDHVNNDGAERRREHGREMASGPVFNYFIRRNGFPSGFQTLCANHQLKKETLHRREKAVENHRAIIHNSRS